MKSLLAILFAGITYIASAQNIAVTSTNLFEGEPYLAIDPTNPQIITAAWMSVELGQEVVIKTSVSQDGGLTWSTPTYFPHAQAGYRSADESMGYDANGNLYIAYIDYDNDNFLSGSVVVRKSTDNGLNWGPAYEAINITDCPSKLCIDRPWIAVDNSSGPNSGAVYVTATNANQPTLVTAPYHPYFAASSDGGVTFTDARELDTAGYLAGTSIPQPMPSPVVAADGTFMACYPSYETSQSVFAQMLLATSTTAGIDLDHSAQYQSMMAGVSDQYAKKAGHLMADPVNPNRLGYVFLSEQNGDADVFYTETTDLANWSTPIRVNDDPVGNDRLQDQVWGKINESGDVAICWRDRRNASSSGYQTETETYCAVRFKDSTSFEANFAVSSVQSPHNAILEGAGNDFICVEFIGDTVYTLWGDVRTGTINIYLNKSNINTGTTSTFEVTKESPLMNVFPNPSSEIITIEHFEEFTDICLINDNGEILKEISTSSFSVKELASGTYWILFKAANKQFSTPVIVK